MTDTLFKAASAALNGGHTAASPIASQADKQDCATTHNAGAVSGDGLGCHGGAAAMRAAAAAAGKSETLSRYAADYPAGPHDQPQSMCPAFGSLRVGLRMRRTATILSGSAAAAA